MSWTTEHMPDQTGRVAIVTGANTGIGYETARALAESGAHVVLAARSEARGRAAMDRLRPERTRGRAEMALLDLASLDSVRAFSREMLTRLTRLDLLINNAGVMAPPQSTTAEGHELQLGVNHLAHFALSGLLLPLIRATPGSRVVTVSSTAHRFGRVDFDDLDFRRRGYNARAAYGQSKLANLLFTLALQRRFQAAGVDAMAVAAHPGWTATELQRHLGPARFLNPLFAMKPSKGALPTLYAATAPEVEPGGYYGPDGLLEMRGHPAPARRTASAMDLEDAERLWQISEERTGVRYASLEPPGE